MSFKRTTHAVQRRKNEQRRSLARPKPERRPQACDVGFPKLEALVRAKLAAAGRKAPPETPLPGAPASFSTEPEEVSEDEAERPGDGDDGRVVLKAYEVPDGFASVDPPERLLGQDALTKDDLYLIICCEDGDWMLGRIAKHKPHAKRFQYERAASKSRRPGETRTILKTKPRRRRGRGYESRGCHVATPRRRVAAAPRLRRG